MVNVAGSRLVLSLKSHARDMHLVQHGSSLGQSRYSIRFKHSQSSETDESIFTRLPPRTKRRSRPRFSSPAIAPIRASLPYPPGLPDISSHGRDRSSSHLNSTPASSLFQSSSSFLIGQDTYLDYEEYIKLQALHMNSGTDSSTARPDSYQIGTVYPDKYQTHWEAI